MILSVIFLPSLSNNLTKTFFLLSKFGYLNATIKCFSVDAVQGIFFSLLELKKSTSNSN
jgi:hypothetical protein